MSEKRKDALAAAGGSAIYCFIMAFGWYLLVPHITEIGAEVVITAAGFALGFVISGYEWKGRKLQYSFDFWNGVGAGILFGALSCISSVVMAFLILTMYWHPIVAFFMVSIVGAILGAILSKV